MSDDVAVMHIRLVVPADERAAVLEYVRGEPSACHVIESSAVTEKPPGIVVEFDIPLESANQVITDLKRLGLAERGSITATRLDVVLSSVADRAEKEARGDPSEAVVWAEVSTHVSEGSRLTFSFVALTVLAILIAAVGILSDNLILIVGAMAVGPEFGPIANAAYGLHRRRPDRVLQGLTALTTGLGLGVVAAFLATSLLDLIGRIPEPYELGTRPLTSFISHPDVFSVVVAVLAGVAGTVSLLEAKSTALVGVFISVTTIPAAANIGVAVAMGEWYEARGALVQLVVNVTCIIVVAAITMTVARAAWHRARNRRAATSPRRSWETVARRDR
jgi:uncharacterized hydrophobic protein (TIGR00271 family)